MNTWFDPLPGQRVTDLRAAAMEYVQHGWPLFAGTYQVPGSVVWHGKPDAAELEPISDISSGPAITDTDTALQTWTRPHSILLALGITIDALELSLQAARRVAPALRAAGRPTPTVASPYRRCTYLLVRHGAQLHPELDHLNLARLRCSWWIPLPPTKSSNMPYLWHTHPRTLDWNPPDANAVQHVLVEKLVPNAPRW